MDPVLLIFIALTLILIFKLISLFGTRTGHEQRQEIETGDPAQRSHRSDTMASAGLDRDDDMDEPAPKPVKPVSATAATLQAADPQFDEADFVNGARAAYEMIVEAFAAGDLKSIRPYLDASVFDGFREAVTNREAAGHTVDLKFVGIDEAELVSASVENGQMQATVAFVSNQVRTTFDANGEVVEGNPNRIDLVKDRWTFARPINARDPNWMLVGTGGAAD